MNREQSSELGSPDRHPNIPAEMVPGEDAERLAKRPHSEALSSLSISMSSTFVGRQQEIGALRVALSEAMYGRGRMVMLVGEPGIGKTRTAQELATIARLSNANVVWGRCYEERGAPPYWPWIQAIRSYIRERYDDANLRSDMGTYASDIAEFIPELEEHLPGSTPRRSAKDPREARFKLFDAVASFLRNVALSQPLVLILDNLHSADRDSIRLLEFLMQELHSANLLVIGTYRDEELTSQHPLAQSLGELTKWQNFQRILLHGLTREDVEDFIQRICGFDPSNDLVGNMHSQTQGNPLFITEIVRLVLMDGKLNLEQLSELQNWSVRLPEGVRQAISRRLGRLSQECIEMLTSASIIGREFNFEVLSRFLDGESTDRMLEVLDEALVARIIEELPFSIGHYQFTHALIQQTVYEQTPPSMRARMHALIAEAMEEVYGNEVQAHAAEMVRHLARAEPLIGAQKLIQYSFMAGERALETYAYEEAQTYFERVLSIKHGQPVDVEYATALFGLGHAQLAMYQVKEAVSSLTRAFEYYIKSGDVSRVVAVAEYPHSPDYVLLMADLIARALDLLPYDSHEAGRILANHGMALGLTSADNRLAQEALDKALEIARRVNDPALEIRTLAINAQVDGFHLLWQKCLEKCLSVIEMTGRVEDKRSEVRAHLWACTALIMQGDPDRASSHAGEAVTTAKTLRDYQWLGYSWGFLADLACLRGDWQAAREFCDQGLAISPRERRLLTMRSMAEFQTGEFGQGRIYLESLLEATRLSALVQPEGYGVQSLAIGAINRITELAESLDVARVTADMVLTSESVSPYRTMVTRAGVALLAVHKGDATASAEHYAWLKSKQGIVHYVGISVFRVLGLLAQTMGDFDNTIIHYEDALSFCRKAKYRPELAWTCHDYADALLQRNVPGDLEKVVPLLNEASSISAELGMRPLNERVATLREKAESQSASSSSFPGGLTQRELEVLRLVAEGKTNPAIAAELGISLNTVKRHLANIFSKTNSANRAEAAIYAQRQHLL